MWGPSRAAWGVAGGLEGPQGQPASDAVSLRGQWRLRHHWNEDVPNGQMTVLA